MRSIIQAYLDMLTEAKAVEEQINLPYEFSHDTPVSNKILTNAFDNGLGRHLSLTNPSERRQSSRHARKTIEKYLGVDKDGETNTLLSKNRKLQKAEKIELSAPDGSGIEVVGLTLAPAYQHGKWTTCPNSESCKKTCLGKTSGGWYLYGGGKAGLEAYRGPKVAYLKRTHALIADPESFAIRLNDEINVAKYKAELNGNLLGVRLNVLSDIHPRVFKKLIDAHPDVQFYDYTKNNTEPIASNHHLTYSSTGVTQPAGYNGLRETVNNPHSNWHQMRRRLNSGHNVAMVFSHKEAIPTHVHDEETGKIYHVISGDEHDFRPIDGRHESGDGYIIGLTNKAKTTKQETAVKESEGFLVQYDPRFKMVGGKQAKDANGNSIPTNTMVTIPKQNREIFTINNDGERE